MVQKFLTQPGYDKPRPSLLVNAASNLVTLGANVILGFLLVPYIIAHIDKQGYGIWTLVISFVGYFGLLRLGVGAAVLRYISLYDGRKNPKAIQKTFSTAMAIYAVVALVIFAISVLAAEMITGFFNQTAEFKTLLVLIGISAAVGCPTAVLDATIRAREKFVVANTLTLITLVLRALALLTTLHLGYGLIGMAWVTLLLALFSLAINIVILAKTCPDIKFSFAMVKAGYLRVLFSFGILATFTSIGATLRFGMDRIIIGRFISMEALGVYAVVATLMQYYRNSMGAATRVLRPRFGYLDGFGRLEKATDLFTQTTKFSAAAACAIALLLMTCGSAFIKLWVGTGFEAAYPVLLVLTTAHIIDQSQTVSIALLGGLGKQGILAVFAIGEGIANIVLCYILVSKFGLFGIALALAIPMVIFQAFIRPVYICRLLKISFFNYYKTCLIKPWILLTAITIAAHSIHLHLYLNTWGHLIASAGAIMLLYSIGCWIFVFDRRENFYITQKLFKIIPAATSKLRN